MNSSILASPYFWIAAVVLSLGVLFALFARRADGSAFVKLNPPTILLHIFYPDSRKVGFGWWLFILASFAAFYAKGPDAKPLLDASTWLICMAFASGLIGGGTIADAKHDLEMAKIDAGKGGPDAPVPVAPAGSPGAAAA